MKCAHRLAPCPSHDVEAMESWLTDMAAQGLILRPDGNFAGIFTFERTTPKRLRYRLASSANMPVAPFWSDCDAPDSQAVELSADMGWKYICRWTRFYVYCCEDDRAPELNTDPQIFSRTLNSLKKGSAGRIVYLLIWIVLLPCLRHFGLGKGGLAMKVINLGSPAALLTVLVVLTVLCQPLYSGFQLERLGKKLQREGDIDHHKDWRRGRGRHWCVKGVLSMVFVLWVVLFFGSALRGASGAGTVAWKDFHGEIPFATLEDFNEGTLSPDTSLFPGTVRTWSDPLSPVNFDYYEASTITLTDGTQWEATLYADYHETAGPWLARMLAQEYLVRYQEQDAKLFEFPELGIDYAVAIQSHGTHIILREGNIMLHAHISQYSDYVLTTEELAAILAESIAD